MSIKKKIQKGMEQYLMNTMLPYCYTVAVRHGFVGDQDDFNAEVLAVMKGEPYCSVQPCCFVAQSGEEAQ